MKITMMDRLPHEAPFGLRHSPSLTAAVFVVTAATSVAQFTTAGVLSSLQRTPAELHGEPWRIVTSLFVQDGGVIGAVSNLVFLAVIGAIAEQILSRPWWLAHYFGIGVLTELLAYKWQPVGGGNSIAICGPHRRPGRRRLARGCAAARRRPAGPADLVRRAVGNPVLAPDCPGCRRRRTGQGGQEQREPVLRPTAVAVAVTGLVLAVATNIHGAALLGGILLASLTMRRALHPSRV